MNGPALAVRGQHTWATWYTEGKDGTPRVLAAVATEKKRADFDLPIEIARGTCLGRSTVVTLDDGSAVIIWLDVDEVAETGTIRARRVTPDRRLGPAITLGKVPPSRASGFPRAAPGGSGRVIVGWPDPVTKRIATRVLTIQ